MLDVERLQQVQRLAETGLNLEGIRRVLAGKLPSHEMQLPPRYAVNGSPPGGRHASISWRN